MVLALQGTVCIDSLARVPRLSSRALNSGGRDRWSYDNMQRIRQPTVQARNETNNRDDLRSIQGEIAQRLDVAASFLPFAKVLVR